MNAPSLWSFRGQFWSMYTAIHCWRCGFLQYSRHRTWLWIIGASNALGKQNYQTFETHQDLAWVWLACSQWNIPFDYVYCVSVFCLIGRNVSEDWILTKIILSYKQDKIPVPSYPRILNGTPITFHTHTGQCNTAPFQIIQGVWSNLLLLNFAPFHLLSYSKQ